MSKLKALIVAALAAIAWPGAPQAQLTGIDRTLAPTDRSDPPAPAASAQQPTETKAGPPKLRDPAVDPWWGLEGNWTVELRDDKGALLSDPPYRDVTLFRRKDDNGKIWWEARGRGIGQRRVELQPDGALKIEHDYFVFGHWGGRSELRASGPDAQTLVGQWSYGKERKGAEIWRRLPRSVQEVEFRSLIRSVATVGGPPAVVEMNYDYTWSPDTDLRGNRPRFEIVVRGENIWGVNVVWIDRAEDLEIRPLGSDPHPVLGVYTPQRNPETREALLRLEAIVWSKAKPGRKTLWVNGVAIPFDLVVHGFPGAPKPKLEALYVENEAGEQIEQAAPGERFRLVARYDGPHLPNRGKPLKAGVSGAHWRAVKLVKLSDGPEAPAERQPFTELELARTGDLRTFKSPLLAFMRGDDDPLSFARTLTGFDPSRTAKVIAGNLAGSWSVQQIGPDGATARGEAVLAADGQGATLTLTTPEGERRYRAVELDAFAFTNPEPGRPDRMLNLRFAEERPARAPADGLVHPLWLDESREDVRFTLDGAQRTLRRAADKQPRIRVALLSTPNGALEGPWSEEIDGRDLAERGRQIWTRGAPRIHGVIVLEDQLGAPQPGTVGVLSTTAYPFGPNPDPRASKARTLFIYGENLPEHGDTAELASLSEHVSYQPQFGSLDRLKEEGWKKAEIADRAGLSALVVRANLAEGVTPGVKTLSVNGARGEWPLMFSGQLADLRFVRLVRTDETDPTAVFFTEDVGYVELEYEGFNPLDAVAVELRQVGPSEVSMGLLQAKRVAAGSRIYRAGPVRFVDWNREGASAPAEGEAMRVAVRPGMEFEARLVDEYQGVGARRETPRPAEIVRDGDRARRAPPDPHLAGFEPARARVSIAAAPTDLGATWDRYVETAAKCAGLTLEEAKENLGRKAAEASRFIVAFNPRLIGRESLDISLGDHAAALLLRDAFLREITALRGRYAQVQANAAAVRGFWLALAQEHPNAREALGRVQVKTPDGKGTVAYAETFGGDAGAPENAEALWAWRDKATKEALTALLAAMDEAIAYAKKGDDCDAERWALLTSLSFDQVVAGVLPGLLKARVDDKGARVWEPDRVARAYVQGVAQLGGLIRNLEDYRRSALGLTSVVALPAFTAAPGLLGAGVVQKLAGGALLLSDAAIAGSTVADYLKDRSEFAFANGASPVIGPDAIEALSGRGVDAVTAAASALGVALPALSAARAALKPAARMGAALELSEAASRGAELARSRTLTPDVLQSLTAPERADAAAYYAALKAKELSRGADSLTEAERGVIRSVEALAESAKTASAPKAANQARLTGARILHDGQELEIGPLLGKGGYNEAYGVVGRDDLIVRARLGADEGDELFEAFGRAALEGAHPAVRSGQLGRVDPDIVRVAKRVGEGVGQPGAPFAGRKYEIVERLPGSAAEQLRNAAMTPGQADAVNRALRELNVKGLVWTDCHTGNFSLVPKKGGGPDDWSIVIIDPGGIMPAGGRTLAERAANARTMQLGVASLKDAQALAYELSLKQLAGGQNVTRANRIIADLAKADRARVWDAANVDWNLFYGRAGEVPWHEQVLVFRPLTMADQPAVRRLFTASDPDAVLAQMRRAAGKPRRRGAPSHTYVVVLRKRGRRTRKRLPTGAALPSRLAA